MHRIPAALLAVASLAVLASEAQAQDSGGKWSFSAGAATDNRSKDASKSDGNPFVYGGAEWANASGLFYASGSLETIDAGAPITEFMRYGDTVKIEMFDANGVSIFGAIDQEVVAPGTHS